MRWKAVVGEADGQAGRWAPHPAGRKKQTTHKCNAKARNFQAAGWKWRWFCGGKAGPVPPSAAVGGEGCGRVFERRRQTMPLGCGRRLLCRRGCGRRLSWPGGVQQGRGSWRWRHGDTARDALAAGNAGCLVLPCLSTDRVGNPPGASWPVGPQGTVCFPGSGAGVFCGGGAWRVSGSGCCRLTATCRGCCRRRP